jgi:glyoxylase-like metal-dependent hydrolase (beta-lactamase superfamily II)
MRMPSTTPANGRHPALRTPLPLVTLLLALSTFVVAQGPRLFSREWYAQFSGAYSQPVEPFRIVGNIYYVGALNIASYLIATPQGHILIDSGTIEMHDGIARGVEQLGYRLSDIRILLASHAHFDHIEAHALMQRRTGAQVMAMGGDAEALESGHDTSALGAIGWEPVPVSRRLKDGDTVSLGGTTLRAIHAPGHSQGATIWMTTVDDGGRKYDVAFLTTTTPNPGVALLDNPRHKNIVEDTKVCLEGDSTGLDVPRVGRPVNEPRPAPGVRACTAGCSLPADLEAASTTPATIGG